MPMPVEFDKTELDGVLVVKTGIARDERGFFSETYSKKVWAESGLAEIFVQDNLSKSAKGTLRGLHYQILPAGMGKLIRCVRGAVFDVAVDLRRGSPTFGRWAGCTLSEGNGLSLWVPVGFAHGFLALEDETLVHYKCSAHHSPAHERSLSYRCPKVGIAWPIAPGNVSKKDREAPELGQAEFNFTYRV